MSSQYTNGMYASVKSRPHRAQYRDFWSLLLLPFIIGLLTLSNFQGLSRIMVLYGFILGGCFLVYFLYHRLHLQPEVIVYFIWVAWSLSGIVIAIDKGIYLQKLLTVIQIGALLFSIAGIVSLKRNSSVVMSAIIISIMIVFLSSYYSGELLQAGEGAERVRVSGIVNNANGFAVNMLINVYAVFYFWRSKTSIMWRLLLIFILGMSALGIVYSGSRTGMLGFVVFIVLWWYFCNRKKLPKNPIKMYVVLLILLAGMYYSANYVLSHTFLGERIQNIEHESSAQTRFDLYEDGFDIIIHNPVFGVGLDNFRAISPLGIYSHTNYMEVASNTGIIGFLLYYSIYFILLKRLNKLKKFSSGPRSIYEINLFRAAIITILITSIATVNYFSKLTWIFMGAVIGYSWSAERILLRLKSLVREDFRH